MQLTEIVAIAAAGGRVVVRGVTIAHNGVDTTLRLIGRGADEALYATRLPTAAGAVQRWFESFGPDRPASPEPTNVPVQQPAGTPAQDREPAGV